IAALKSGKAVFCQKPLGRTAEEVKEVVKASKDADRLLAVDLSYRKVRAFEEIQRLVSSKEIGDIFAVDLIFHNAYGPDKEWFYDFSRAGGGCVMDLGVHLVDYVLWCLGFPEIRDVNSSLFYKGRNLQEQEEQVEDYASVSMTSAEGTLINMQCSWHIS